MAAPSRTIGVAIPIPDPYGRELQLLRESLGDPLAASIPTHITLVPPTLVDESRLRPIEEHLGTVAAGERGFEITLYGPGSFRPVSPVVFAAVKAGSADCERIERRVRRGPLMRDPVFPYHPHVTVAHVQPGDGRGEDVLDLAVKELAGYEARFAVPGFSLYEHGADRVWRPRREFRFGA